LSGELQVSLHPSQIGHSAGPRRPIGPTPAATSGLIGAKIAGMMAPARPTKITFAELRDMGVRGLLVYCADHHCSHSKAISGDSWPDEVRLSDIEPRFTCAACGKRGADVRPDFDSNKQTVPMMGY
jgi:hypothetical protein